MNGHTKESDPSSPKWMWGNIFKKKDLSKASIREALQNIPLFQDLSSKELSRIQDSLYLRKYRADEFIFREGEPALGMYIIHRGSVWIEKKKALGKEALEPVLELEKGDFFGEMSLLDEHPHIVSARAHTYTELMGFFRPDFLTLVRYHPRLGTKLLLSLGHVVSARLRASFTNMEGE